MEGCMLLFESFSKLQHFTSLAHVHNMDVHFLEKQIHFLIWFILFCFSEPSRNVRHSPCSQTEKWCPTGPPLLFLYFCTACVPCRLNTNDPSLTSTTVCYSGTTLEHVPLLAMAMAAALPIPLLAPVIIKDRPTTDTSKSLGSKFWAAASYPFLEATYSEYLIVSFLFTRFNSDTYMNNS